MAANPAATAPTTLADKRFPGGPQGYDIVAFAVDFLKGIGAPVTPSNVSAVVGWANAESSGYNPGASGGRNNPLNIVRTPGDGSSGQGGSQGNIADFPDPATGVAATIRFFNNIPGPKADIIRSFRKDSGIGAIQSAVAAFYGQWGAGGFHFAGGPSVTPASIAGAPSAGQGGTQAHTTGWESTVFGGVLAGVLGPLGIALSDIPNIGGGLKVFLGILSNWRYFAEVAIGVGLMIFGTLLVMHDTVGAKPSQLAAVAALA